MPVPELSKGLPNVLNKVKMCQNTRKGYGYYRP